MPPKLVVFCAHPVTGKTELATYMERELGFARVDWDKLTRESEIHDRSKAHPGCDYIDESWRRTLAERDQFLAQNRNVVIDSPATNISSRDRLLDSSTECKRYTIVIEIPNRFHLKLLKKRCPRTEIDINAVYEIHECSWWGDPQYNRIPSEIIRLRNWYWGSLSSMKKAIKRKLENAQ